MAAWTLNSAVSNGSPQGTWGNPVVCKSPYPEMAALSGWTSFSDHTRGKKMNRSTTNRGKGGSGDEEGVRKVGGGEDRNLGSATQIVGKEGENDVGVREGVCMPGPSPHALTKEEREKEEEKDKRVEERTRREKELERKEGEDKEEYVNRYRRGIRAEFLATLKKGRIQVEGLSEKEEKIREDREGKLAAFVAALVSASEEWRLQVEEPREREEVLEIGRRMIECVQFIIERKERLSEMRKERENQLLVAYEEIERLREEARAGIARDTPSSVPQRTAGVQVRLCPKTKEEAVQAVRGGEVDEGGTQWSKDQVSALIDRRFVALREGILAEVCKGSSGGLKPPPA